MTFVAATVQSGMRLWIGSALAALLAHAGVAAALMLHLDWHQGTMVPPPAAMTVELVELPAAPPIPITHIAPGPKRVESKTAPQPQTIQSKPKFELLPDVKTVTRPDIAVPKPEPEQDLSKSPPVPATTAPTTAPSRPNKDLQAPTVGVASNVPSTAEQAWEAKVLAQLERNKRYPGEAQRQHLEDTVYLHFTMNRKGRVLTDKIERSSGYGLLDAEVLALIQRASPLPPPKKVTGDPLELVAPVEFFIR